MAGSWKLEESQRAIGRLRQDGLPWEILSAEIVRHLRRAVGFDGWCFAVDDPATALPTAAVGQDSPLAACQRRFWQLEYRAPDASPATARRPVVVLSRATSGDLTRSRRWDELLRPAGAGDELRAALTAGGLRWGSLTLYRARDGGRFSAADIDAVEALRSALAAVARASWIARPPGQRPPGHGDGDDGESAPATLIGTTEGTLLHATPDAYARLAGLGGYRQAGYTLVYALLARLAAGLARADGGAARLAASAHPTASAVTRTADGRWAELHAAPLAGADGPGGLAAVTVRPAPAARVRSVLVHAYGLSGRERQVAALAITGRQSGEIASALCISPYTARDHLKAVFRKTGSHTRQELGARLGGSGGGGCDGGGAGIR
jgi:DNA-binding CsgD family transcriptional regulator